MIGIGDFSASEEGVMERDVILDFVPSLARLKY
jgi:hypothetical protein